MSVEKATLMEKVAVTPVNDLDRSPGKRPYNGTVTATVHLADFTAVPSTVRLGAFTAVSTAAAAAAAAAAPCQGGT